MPTESKLEKNVLRWYKPSLMFGVQYDVDKFKNDLIVLLQKYWDEFIELPSYAYNSSLGFGPGYTELDALVLYMIIRQMNPNLYLEVGSGLSTYYCSLAAQQNMKSGNQLRIQCIEPFPLKGLYSIPGIDIIKSEVQDVNIDKFLQLQENDILFIDSSHVLMIDGDVPYLYLEILPRLRKGVIIHIHDIPFPFNIPYPPEQWVLGKTQKSPFWPMYWNEAMFLQAFLVFNSVFEIIMSAPLIR